MNKIHKISAVATGIAASIVIYVCSAVFGSCRGGVPASTENGDSLPKSVVELMRAVSEGDSLAFARMVSYPLIRPYPLHDILNPEQMVAYYSTLVDDSLRQIITSSSAAEWDEYGWRGWTLGDGKYLWIDGALYDVNYISSAEQAEISRLRQLETASLNPKLRKGWIPVSCLTEQNGGRVFRIDEGKDSKGAPIFRLTSFKSPADMSGEPEAIYSGYRHSEGTAAIITYRFSGERGEEVIYQADIPDGTLPALEFTGKADTTISVRPAYWLDLL